jgi:hypothetical protein
LLTTAPGLSNAFALLAFCEPTLERGEVFSRGAVAGMIL